LTPSIDAYLVAEQSCQISFFEEVAQQQKKNKMRSNMRSALDPKR